MKYLLPIVCSLLLIGCGDSAQTETPVAPETETVETAAAPAPETAVTAAQEVQETPAAAVAAPEEPSAAPVAAAPAEPKPAAKPAAPKPSPKPAEPKPAPEAVAPAPSVDGGTVFAQKCASCHGMKAEKAALGKSQVIAGWSEQQVKEALKGYQAGTYGKEMKALMQGQAKALSDAQIDAIAKHVSGL